MVRVNLDLTVEVCLGRCPWHRSVGNIRTKVQLDADDDNIHGCCFLVEGAGEEFQHLPHP